MPFDLSLRRATDAEVQRLLLTSSAALERLMGYLNHLRPWQDPAWPVKVAVFTYLPLYSHAWAYTEVSAEVRVGVREG